MACLARSWNSGSFVPSTTSYRPRNQSGGIDRIHGRTSCPRFARVSTTDTSIAGELPVNTGGGQLSCGQSGAGGGGIGLSHAIQQLQGESGAWQVAGAEVGLVSGFGLVSYGKGLCTAGALLATAA